MNNDPFNGSPGNRGPIIPPQPNRQTRRAEQAKARRERAKHRVPRTLPTGEQGAHIQLAEASCLLDAVNAYGDQWSGDATMHELNEGQMLTYLVAHTAEMFGPKGITLDRCAELLHLTMEIALRRRVVDAIHEQAPAGHAPNAEPPTLAVLLDRMVERGPALREALLKESGPMPNLIVRQLLLSSVNLTALHHMQQPSADFIDVCADVLWLCRAIAFAEGLLAEPAVAQS